jgi:cytochrome P450
MQQRPPGPKPHFLIGNMPLASRDPLIVLTRWAREYGDLFYYRAGWIDVYFFNRPDLIELVLVRNHANLLKDRVVQNSRWFLGNGLLTSEGEEWKRQRRLTQPAFYRERIASHATLMTGYTEQMLAAWQDSATVDVHQQMMNLTLRIVVRTLFGVEAGEIDEISGALNTIMRHTSGIGLLLPPWSRYLPIPAMGNVRRAIRKLNATVGELIDMRRAQCRTDPEDLLSTLFSARDQNGAAMSGSEVRDQVLTFLLAGHEDDRACPLLDMVPIDSESRRGEQAPSRSRYRSWRQSPNSEGCTVADLYGSCDQRIHAALSSRLESRA